MKRKGDSDLGCLIVVVLLVMIPVAYGIGISDGFTKGKTSGRIDIASGRVVGERVVNADGLTEWRWKEKP